MHDNDRGLTSLESESLNIIETLLQCPCEIRVYRTHRKLLGQFVTNGTCIYVGTQVFERAHNMSI